MKIEKIKYDIFFVLIILLLSFQTRDVFAETIVGGNITEDTTWTLANSPYMVTSTVQVLEGVTLTIESGVVVEFDPNIAINIGGVLRAIGTETLKITFTGSNWGGIHFIGGNSGATFDINGNYIDGSIIKYSIIQNVGGYRAIEMVHSAPFITHNSILNNGGYSIYVGYPNARITNNIISYNDSGIQLDSSSVNSVVIIDNDISNNLTNGIYIWGPSMGSMVVQNNKINNNGSVGLAIGSNGATVSNNTINNNARGGLSLGGCGNKVTKNTITGNGNYGVENHGSFLQFQYNNLYSNLNYDLKNSSKNSVFNGCFVDVTATNNWWGTTDSAIISGNINDYYDDISLSKVIYQTYASTEYDITIITGDIIGTIRNSTSGNPIIGASVSGSFGSFMTDGFGKYLISNLSPDIYVLTVNASKYISSTINNVTVSPGAQTVLDIFLVTKTTGTLTGQVLNSEGLTPVSNATVNVTKGTDSLTKITDVNGNFSFNDLLAGDYTVELISTSYWSNQHNTSVNIDETTQLTITGIPQAVVGDIRNGWFTQDQLNQAVAGANAAKDVIIAQKDNTITALNDTITSKDQIIASMFTQQQLNQAVANANAAKDLIIGQKDQNIITLNSTILYKDQTIASMYTKAQLDQTVADANTAKDTIIAQKEQVISSLNSTITQNDLVIADLNTTIIQKNEIIARMFTQLQVDQAVTTEKLKYDPNGDGNIGLEEVIYYIQVLTGVRSIPNYVP